MFDVGIPELVLILVVALVVFGPGKLPEIGAGLGKTIREFRKATQGFNDEIQSVTKIESEDEMRTRLITERNAKAAVPEVVDAPVAFAMETPVAVVAEMPAAIVTDAPG